MRRIGIDIGGVIIERATGKSDTSFFGKRYLETPPVPGVFAAIGQIVHMLGADNVFLVSKCGVRVEEKTRDWLAHYDFYGQTGVRPEQALFCRERRQKAPICKTHRITHFVDDKLGVLSFLIGIVPNLYLFRPEPNELAARKPLLAAVHLRTDDWQDIVNDVTTPIREEGG